MAFTTSAIFQQAMLNPLLQGMQGSGTTGFPTTYHGMVYDTINCALFGGASYAGTPDRSVALSASLYTAGQWLTSANYEIPGSGGYTQGGVAVTPKTFTLDSTAGVDTINFCNASTPPTWAAATIVSAYGCLIYNNITTGSYAKQGYCFNYFGGAQSVTSGTFTIIWSTVGALTSQVIFNVSVGTSP